MLWQPGDSRIRNSLMAKFMAFIAERTGEPVSEYADLYRYSVDHSEDFWCALLAFFEVDYRGTTDPVNTDPGFHQYGWFPNLQLNFAQNLLAKGKDLDTALVGLREDGSRRALTYLQLRHQVAALQQSIKPFIKEDDCLACYMPNVPETVVSMLATTGLGGIFTSTSSDFGEQGVIDRFGQSEPRVMVAASGYRYNGKYFDLLPRLKAIAAQLPCVEKLIVVSFDGGEPEGWDDFSKAVPHASLWDDMLRTAGPASEPDFLPRPFAAPLYIMYSSGTTGKPKCIVHTTGGVLLQHIKELGLHSDMQAGKKLFFFTTCGWMMWNWLVSGLFFGGAIYLYEGSPGYPSLKDFVSTVAREGINLFGTSPKFLKALEDSHADLSDLDLSALETLLSTGSPLLPEQYDYVYRTFKEDLLLASISGGTDIIGCFFLGNPLLPVYRGTLQCAGLGMAVDCVDEEGRSLPPGEEGELVCRKSFPSRPLRFLNDANGERIREAYFDQFPGIWYHGDFIALTEQGGAVFYGRSDATLNPGGVRIGTAEIYRQTETLDYIEDTCCVGRKIPGDVEVVLFVKLKEGEHLSEEREDEIRRRIRDNTTPRHMPRAVYGVTDIPYTRSGKKMEMVVNKIVNGKPVTNREAIANPDCLEEYRQFAVE